MPFLYFLFHLLCLRVVVAISVSDIPLCAQNCLSNSTAAQTSCSVIDIACLCSSSTYVSALSCCLYTQCNSDEQTVAIQFNKQECAAVNETAPDFVGCSPAGLSSALASMSLTPPAPTSTASPIPTSSSSPNPKLSTITGDVVPETAAPTSGKQSTATFEGRPLMTGSCTVPYFAMITDASGMVTEYPNIGCSSERLDCCPFPDGTNEGITRCPQDYFTTANACCPFGFQIYYTAVGGDIPCYSDLATKLVPATTPTVSGLTLITDHVFAQKYRLVTAAPAHEGLSLGAKIAIPVAGGVVAIAILAALILFVRRRRKAKREGTASRSTTFPPEEPALHQMAATASSRRPTTHELPSPEMTTMTMTKAGSPVIGGGTTGQGQWHLLPSGGGLGSSPPAYDQKTSPFSGSGPGPATTKKQVLIPQELPGSTFIHEHHPAFSPVVGSPTTTTTTAPSNPIGAAKATSPPRTPVQRPVSSTTSATSATNTNTTTTTTSEKRSPVLTSVTPTPAPTPTQSQTQTPRSETTTTRTTRTHSPPFVSPLGSPRLPLPKV